MSHLLNPVFAASFNAFAETQAAEPSSMKNLRDLKTLAGQPHHTGLSLAKTILTAPLQNEIDEVLHLNKRLGRERLTLEAEKAKQKKVAKPAARE